MECNQARSDFQKPASMCRHQFEVPSVNKISPYQLFSFQSASKIPRDAHDTCRIALSLRRMERCLCCRLHWAQLEHYACAAAATFTHVESGE